MAIAFDSISAAVQNGGSPLTFAFNNVAGNFVAVILDPAADTVSGVTWGGVAMTLAGTSQGNTGRFSQIWYKVGAATGSNNIVITGGGVDIYARAISFSGVDTGVTVSGYASGGATSATPSLAVTTTADNSFVLVGGQIGATATAGANTTQPSSGANPQLAGWWYSTVAVTPAGAFTANMNASGGGAYGIVGIAITPKISVLPTDTSISSDSVILGTSIITTETVASSDSSTTVKIGFANTSKHNSTFTNQQKT